MSAVALLEAEGLSKRFGGLQAVDGVGLRVESGRIVSLIGPNGAGKTTLFAMLSGFVAPDSGRVCFDGRDVTGWKPHRVSTLGLVRTFQLVQPFAGLSVRENIAVGAHARIRRRRDALEHSDAVAERFGMSAMLERPAHALTVAARKRLEVARAVAAGPRLLLLDEVMAGLTPTEVDEMVEMVRGVRDTGVTVFLIEHVMRAVMRLSEHTFVLANGAIIASGAPRSVVADPQVVEAYLGHGAAARLAGGGDARG